MKFENIENLMHTLYRAKGVDHFLSKANDVSAGAPAGYPTINYFGLNFLNDEIYNLKLYFGFNHFLSLDQVRLFLPRTTEFELFYPFWQPRQFIDPFFSPCSFAIKIDKHLRTTIQFHMRFHYLASALPISAQVEFTEFDMAVMQGISFEYCEDKCVEKKYYYLLPNSTGTQQLLAQFKLPFVGQFLEYTEVQSERKIIHWVRSPRRAKEFLYKTSLGTKYFDSTMAIAEKYSVTPIFPGNYLHKNMKSIYFFKFNDLCDLPFASEKNARIDTLGHVFGRAPFLKNQLMEPVLRKIKRVGSKFIDYIR